MIGSTTQDNAEMIAPGPSGHTDWWRRYYAGDAGESAEEELVKHFLPLVKSIVGRLMMTLPSHLDPKDLFSAGSVGLLNAIRNYKPESGTPFVAYARLRIRGEILDELRRMNWAPRSVHSKTKRIQSAMDALEQEKGRIPTDQEVAAALGISEGEYEKWLDEIRPATFVSLDTVSSFEGEGDPEFQDESRPGALENVSQRELAALIAERIQQLPALQKKVLALYYFEDLRICEIAKVTGFCESHICQVHAKAILAIRTYIQAYEGRRQKQELAA